MASKRKAKTASKRKTKQVVVEKTRVARPMSEEDRVKAMRARQRNHSPGVSTVPRADVNRGENYMTSSKRTRG